MFEVKNKKLVSYTYTCMYMKRKCIAKYRFRWQRNYAKSLLVFICGVSRRFARASIYTLCPSARFISPSVSPLSRIFSTIFYYYYFFLFFSLYQFVSLSVYIFSIGIFFFFLPIALLPFQYTYIYIFEKQSNLKQS